MTLQRRAVLVLAGCALAAGCGQGAPPEERRREPAGPVVVYSSVDDVFARPIAQRFQDQTGIEVRLVPDTEETKSTGLLNRLIAERERPQADVFWSGDPVRAAVLTRRGTGPAFRRAPAC